MSRRAAAKEGSSSAYTSFQQKRRAQALDRQKNAREDKVQQLRTLALAAMQVGEVKQASAWWACLLGEARIQAQASALADGTMLFTNMNLAG